MVARMVELSEAVTQELLESYSGEEYGDLLRDVRAGMMGDQTGK